MLFTWEIFRSVEDVWVVWLLGAGALAWLIVRAGRQRRWRRLAGFLADDRGASYALPYVLTFPVYMLLICVMIQATMILMVKMGTVYAAYAAARAAVVWRSAEPGAADDSQAETVVRQKAQQAAALAMTPLASSQDSHYQAVAPYRLSTAASQLPATMALLPVYYGAYQLMQANNASRDNAQSVPAFIPANEAESPVGLQYVFFKLRYAMMATDVSPTIEKNEFNAAATVAVDYLMPMLIPGAGRILGNSAASDEYYARTIHSTATLPLETPTSDNQRLGIPYESD